MDDAAARLPETRAVARRGAAQEGVDLLVLVHRPRQIRIRADLRLDQVVAVHGGWHHHPLEAGQLELQQRHLRRRVLQRHPIGLQLGVILASPQRLGARIYEMPEEDLLRQRQRTIQPLARHRHPVP